jgi:hypothetical protein
MACRSHPFSPSISYAGSMSHRGVPPINIEQQRTRPRHVCCVVRSSDESDDSFYSSSQRRSKIYKEEECSACVTFVNLSFEVQSGVVNTKYPRGMGGFSDASPRELGPRQAIL